MIISQNVNSNVPPNESFLKKSISTRSRKEGAEKIYSVIFNSPSSKQIREIGDYVITNINNEEVECTIAMLATLPTGRAHSEEEIAYEHTVREIFPAIKSLCDYLEEHGPTKLGKKIRKNKTDWDPKYAQ